MNDLERLRSALSGRYLVDREIGAGGMATVFAARDLKHDRPVAIKLLRADVVSLGAERFHREIRVAAQLQHPHILPLLDSGEAAGMLYYVMPLVDGESLRRRLAGGPLPVNDAVRVLAEMADALAHAHARGVIHRDIKPDNVLFIGRHIVVTDFGVAKALDDATGENALTAIGVALGTPAYMAPEQASAEPHVDARADIYALGCVGYELLTGRTPFAGLGAGEMLAAQVTKAPRPPRELRVDIPEELEAVIMRCLAKRPEDRWQSAQELLDRLESQVTPGTGMMPAARSRRNRLIPVGAGLVLGAGALAGVAAVVSRDEAIAIGRQQQVTFEPGLEIEPALSPDGRLVAYAAGPLGDTRIYVRQIGGRPVPVTATSRGAQRMPTWSPDGTRLAFVENNELVVAAAVGGGVSRPIASGAAEVPVRTPAWSPDGDHIAFRRGDTMFVVSPEGTGQRVLVVANAPTSPTWSPDGEYIVYAMGNPGYVNETANFGNLGAGSLMIVSSRGGTPRRLLQGTALNAAPVWGPAGMLYFVSNRDGPRDVYAVRMRRGEAVGEPRRLSVGLGVHTLSLAGDAQVAYSVLVMRSNVYTLPLDAAGVLGSADARAVTTGNQTIEAMSASLDGRRLYFDSDRAGNSDIYRIALPSGEPEQLTDHPTHDFAPVESPDGREIAFYSLREGDRRIFLMDADGRNVRALNAGGANQLHPAWSPDGRWMVYRIDGGQASRAREMLLVSRGADASWSPPKTLFDRSLIPSWFDSTSVLVTESHEARAIDARTGQSRTLFRFGHDDAFPTEALRATGDGRAVLFRIGPAGRRIELYSRGARRVVAELDTPGRPEFFATPTAVYFTVMDRQSDIHVAELKKN